MYYTLLIIKESLGEPNFAIVRDFSKFAHRF